MSLKLALWEGSAELEELSVQWKECHFEALDVAAMDEAIARYVCVCVCLWKTESVCVGTCGHVCVCAHLCLSLGREKTEGKRQKGSEKLVF